MPCTTRAFFYILNKYFLSFLLNLLKHFYFLFVLIEEIICFPILIQCVNIWKTYNYSLYLLYKFSTLTLILNCMNSKIKLLAIVALLPFLFLSQSCDKIKDLASFDASADLPTETITIDSMDYKSSDNLLSWNVLKQYDITVDVQKILDDNDVSSASFENGRVDTYEARLISPSGVTFSFLSQMRATIALQEDFSDEVIVAETETIDPSTNTVTFNTFDVDITSFIDAKTFYMRLYGYKTTQLPVPSVDIDVDGKVKFTVKPI